MLELKGKFSSAKIFTDNVDTETLSQVYNLLNNHLSKDSQVRIMPDTHAGAGNVIGLTMTLTDKVAPSLVGSDIGCGVLLMGFKLDKELDLVKLDNIIREKVPYGYLQRSLLDITEEDETTVVTLVQSLKFKTAGLIEKALKGFGTLGGGNHFIEAYHSKENDTYYLAIHTGSRSLGGAVYKYYESRAINEAYQVFITKRAEVVEKLKKENKHSEIQSALLAIRNEFEEENSLDKEIKYLSGGDLEDYLYDMNLVQTYASLNRHEIATNIIDALGAHIEYTVSIDKPHNYIDVEHKILRKGSQSAQWEEDVLIPINMRDGMIIGVGKGNSDWNYSAPHGAGRVLSRTQAFDKLDLEKFKEQMKDIYSTTVTQETLDEAPDAYKTLEEILENIKDSVEVLEVIKPIYNFKGGKEFKKFIKTETTE